MGGARGRVRSLPRRLGRPRVKLLRRLLLFYDLHHYAVAQAALAVVEAALGAVFLRRQGKSSGT